MVESPRDVGMGEERLRFGAEDDASARRLAIKERLLSHPVAGEDEPLPRNVPDPQGEHAVEVASEVGTMLLVQVDEALGVAFGPEDVASRLEPGSQLGVVIKLAVIGNPDGAVLVGHRLRAAVDVDDRQPTMPESGCPLAV